MKIERERGRGFIKQSDTSLEISNRVVEIIPVVETKLTHVEEKAGVEIREPAIVVPESTTTLEGIFAGFLELEVGDGAASADTIRSYLSQTKQYLDWCRDNLLPPLEADAEDLKLYLQYLVQSEYANSTIATKLNIIRIFYKASLAHGLIENNPVQNIKAPKERKDPAARITFMEAEELKFLLVHVQSSRVVPLTDNLTAQLDEYLELRRRILRRKIKPSDYVFVSLSNNSKGKQISRRSIRAIIDGYLKGTNLKYTPGRTLSAHSLRHTAGTLALRTGSDLRQVQDLLGHADPRTTSIYAHVGDRWENNPGDNIERDLYS